MTTHRMTIEVRAWQVQPRGLLPEEGRLAAIESGFRFDPFDDSWSDGFHTARPEDWIVAHEHRCEAMTDAQFRACCTEVEP